MPGVNLATAPSYHTLRDFLIIAYYRLTVNDMGQFFAVVWLYRAIFL